MILIALALLLTLASVIYRVYFSNYTVTTWEDWCAQALREDLSKAKGASVIGYDYQSIKEDFVRKYNEAYVTAAAKGSLNKNPDDETVREMVRQKRLGVWFEGTHLHVANCFVGMPNDPHSVPFKLFYEKWKLHTNLESLENLKQNLTNRDYCTQLTMNDFFEDVTLHCYAEAATLPLAFRVQPAAQK